MSLQKVNWLKGVSIIGLVLGLLLLVQGIQNYLHVRHLVLDHLKGEAAKFITELEILADDLTLVIASRSGVRGRDL